MTIEETKQAIRATENDRPALAYRGPSLQRICSTDDLKALVEREEELTKLLVEAVDIGRTQANEWDRYWNAIGCGTSETTVDDCIRLWQEREAEIEQLREALIYVRDGREAMRTLPDGDCRGCDALARTAQVALEGK